MCLVIVVVLTTVVQAQGLITSVTRRGGSTQLPPQLGGILQESSLALEDRTHVYKNVPGYLAGIAEYVRIDNDDRSTADFLLDLVLSWEADVYVFIDCRVGDGEGDNPPTLSDTVMPWVAQMGFADTGDQIDIDEGNDGDIDQHFRIYKARFQAGTVTLKEQNNGGSRNMYGVAAVLIDPTFNPTPEVDIEPEYQLSLIHI